MLFRVLNASVGNRDILKELGWVSRDTREQNWSKEFADMNEYTAELVALHVREFDFSIDDIVTVADTPDIIKRVAVVKVYTTADDSIVTDTARLVALCKNPVVDDHLKLVQEKETPTAKRSRTTGDS